LQENAIQVTTIEPDAASCLNLEEIGNELQNSAIVMLREQDFRAAPIFLVKANAIKYLHKKNGFFVWAFENDFFGLNDQGYFVRKGKLNMDNFITGNINKNGRFNKYIDWRLPVAGWANTWQHK
jgi:erythromycin esterase-like protein